ncbi:MAG: glutamate formimidoyltransferase [Candidatus Polarisedimenticolia bacterium]
MNAAGARSRQDGEPAATPGAEGQLVECVPNVSEGRDPDLVAALAQAARRAGPARLVDLSSDPDHNRSVFTFAGAPRDVLAAIEALVAAAVDRIDLRRHRGSHPRMGAVDVIPFVPVRRATMAECVALAHDAGRAIAARHGIPVYLYERAATAPHRRNLADVRRGGFEGFPGKIRDPLWKPDYGPDRVHPSAGCVAVGARPFLIAFNVNLASPDLETAKAIARAVRESSGGLPCVKAMGVPLTGRGRVQVSMNLTDYRTTSIARAFEAVRAEAARRGVEVDGSEIVGLVPAEALVGAAAELLKVEGFSPERILEHRLEEGA